MTHTQLTGKTRSAITISLAPHINAPQGPHAQAMKCTLVVWQRWKKPPCKSRPGYLVSSSCCLWIVRGGSRILKRGGHNFVTVSMVVRTQSGMQNMPNLGGSGGMPPRKFEKINPLRLNLRAFLMAYCLYYFKTAHCTIIEIYLIMINISSKI